MYYHLSQLKAYFCTFPPISQASASFDALFAPILMRLKGALSYLSEEFKSGEFKSA